MQLCSMKQGTVSPWTTDKRCFRVLQVFPTMSDCESWENTTSCSQDVIEGGCGSNAPQSKVASCGLTYTLLDKVEDAFKFPLLALLIHMMNYTKKPKNGFLYKQLTCFSMETIHTTGI